MLIVVCLLSIIFYCASLRLAYIIGMMRAHEQAIKWIDEWGEERKKQWENLKNSGPNNQDLGEND